MSEEPVIACFAEELERFFGLLGKQIDVCPEGLWEKACLLEHVRCEIAPEAQG